jgi:hypothetical protein
MSDKVETVKVAMVADARPRGAAMLKAGSEYTLPKAMADRLAQIGKATIVADKKQSRKREKAKDVAEEAETPPTPTPEERQ